MIKHRSAALALAACAASLTVAACSAGTPTASSAASSPAASSSNASALPVSSSAPPTTGAPIPGRMLTIKGALGAFPVPAKANVGENMSGGTSVILVFGSITPVDVARFYATALPQAGYTVTTNSLVSNKAGQNGALIQFTGHGYKGNIESVNQVSGPSIAGLSGDNVTTVVISATS